MTDAELIARLRDEHVAASRTEAADRIEALIAERDEAMQLLKTLSNMNGDLSRDLYKTKLLLEKAVGALKMMCEEFRGYDLPYGSKAYSQATAALAEIKGENRE